MNKLLTGLALTPFLMCGTATIAADNITIAEHTAWVRATPPGTSTSAIYLTLMNHGKNNTKLTSATATISERLELHTHSVVNGMMKMQQIPFIDLPAGGTVELKPHGNHIMVFNLAAPLVAGDTVELNLLFDNQQELLVVVPVAKNTPQSSQDQHSDSEHNMKKPVQNKQPKSH